jgi:hypothetical protein
MPNRKFGPLGTRPTVPALPVGGPRPRNPFGAAFAGPSAESGGLRGKLPDIDHAGTTTPFDARGVADWVNIFGMDTSGYRWGQVLIECLAKPSLAANTAINLLGPAGYQPYDLATHIEARILAYLGGTASIVFEAAVASREYDGGKLSTGAATHIFREGEVPDRIEVMVRGRMGPFISKTSYPDESLLASVNTRFRR